MNVLSRLLPFLPGLLRAGLSSQRGPHFRHTLSNAVLLLRAGRVLPTRPSVGGQPRHCRLTGEVCVCVCKCLLFVTSAKLCIASLVLHGRCHTNREPSPHLRCWYSLCHLVPRADSSWPTTRAQRQVDPHLPSLAANLHCWH